MAETSRVEYYMKITNHAIDKLIVFRENSYVIVSNLDTRQSAKYCPVKLMKVKQCTTKQ
jgi:hypothetical protein